MRSKITFERPNDADCLVLAEMGMHTAAIAERTGLTPSMVQYRIIKGGGKGIRRAFRDGKTPVFEAAFKGVSPILRRRIERELVPIFKSGAKIQR